MNVSMKACPVCLCAWINGQVEPFVTLLISTLFLFHPIRTGVLIVQPWLFTWIWTMKEFIPAIASALVALPPFFWSWMHPMFIHSKYLIKKRRAATKFVLHFYVALPCRRTTKQLNELVLQSSHEMGDLAAEKKKCGAGLGSKLTLEPERCIWKTSKIFGSFIFLFL